MKQLKWTTVQRRIGDLVPQADNYKKLSEDRKQKLIESLQKFGIVDIPVIDFDNTVISGHQRLVSLIAMGKEDDIIDVRYPNRKLTKAELKEYTIIANKQYGEIDFDMLQEYVADVDLDIDMLEIDFSKADSIIEEETTVAPPKKSETVELKPFKETLVLLSFPPENLLEIQPYLEELKKFSFVQFDQTSI